MKRLLVASASAAMVLGGTTLLAAPADAAAPTFTGGLVNVTVSNVDILNGVNVLNNSPILNNVLNGNNVAVGVAANVAAAVCDVNVGGILGTLRSTGTFTCTAANNAANTLTITQAQ